MSRPSTLVRIDIYSLLSFAPTFFTFHHVFDFSLTANSWFIAILGSVVAGITSAIWWTAQGVYFEHTCRLGCGVSDAASFKTIEQDDIFDSKKYASEALNILRADLSGSSFLLYDISVIFSLISVLQPLSADWTLIYQGMLSFHIR
jgi:hypothetical protein